MIIIESKLNHLTLEELELINPNPFTVVINKLLNENVYNKPRLRNAIIRLADNIALIETNKRLNQKSNVRGIYFNNSKGIWVANRVINGKLKHIKSGKDKDKVKEAYEKFCIENNYPY